MITYRQLNQAWLMNDCSPSTREALARIGKIAVFPRRHVLIRLHEETQNVFLVLNGVVEVYTLSHSGRKKTLFLFGKGNIVNDSIMKGSSSVYCETLQQCTLYVMNRQAFLEVMARDHALMEAVFAYQENKLHRIEHMARNSVSTLTIERKLAAKIWRLGKDFGVPVDHGLLIDVDVSITLLASLLGVPRENASRAAGKLTALGLISVERKKICIHDPDRLAYYFHHGVPSPDQAE